MRKAGDKPWEVPLVEVVDCCRWRRRRRRMLTLTSSSNVRGAEEERTNQRRARGHTGRMMRQVLFLTGNCEEPLKAMKRNKD